jgi:hypothetical protein
MGIAVASDTLLTVTLAGQDNFRKPLGNSRKIHELGDGHKVLVLSAGVATVNSIPIELFVLRWSKQLKTPLADVDAYAQSFIDWFAQNSTGRNRPEDDAVEDSAANLLWWVYRELHQRLETETNVEFLEMPELWDPGFNNWFIDNPDQAKKYTKALRETVENVLRDLPTLWSYEFFNEATALKSMTATQAKKVVDSFFTEKAMQPSVRQKLVDAMPSSLHKRISQYLPQTLITFAGYGEQSFTPQYRTILVEGALPGMVMGWMSGSSDGIDGVTIYYPAQKRAISTFLRGFDPSLPDRTEEFLKRALVVAKYNSEGSGTLDAVNVIQSDPTAITAMVEDIQHYFEEFGESNNSKLLDTMGAMDLTGIADIAESLTGLEILAAHNDEGAPTSGGVVEVATIDLQYGIQWHRRISRIKSGLTQANPQA